MSHYEINGPHDNVPPITEEEAEKLHERQERLMTRIHARFRRERLEIFREIVRKEVERMREEDEASGTTPVWDVSPLEFRAEEDPHDRDEEPDQQDEDSEAAGKPHPLATSVMALGKQLFNELRTANAVPEGASPEHPLAQLVTSTARAGMRLGDLMERYPPVIHVAAMSIVGLKRVRIDLEDARAGLDDAREQGLMNPAWLEEMRTSLTSYIEQVDALIAELRTRIADADRPHG